MKSEVRHNIFVEGIIAGKSLIDAYLGAGYKAQRSTAYKCASRLVRNVQIVKLLDERLFNQKRLGEQRLGSMTDGATNAYIRIMKLEPGMNEKLLELQRKVAADIFDRIGCKPVEKLQMEHSGNLDITIHCNQDLNLDEI